MRDCRTATLDAAPLIAAVLLADAEPKRPVGTWPTPETRAWIHARDRGRLTVYMADRMCVRLLGKHPATVFGQAWWDAVDPATARPARPGTRAFRCGA